MSNIPPKSSGALACPLGRIIPETMDKPAVKRAIYQRDNIGVIAADEWSAMSWMEEQVIRRFLNRHFGERG